MALREDLEFIASKYSEARQSPFSNNTVAKFIRDEAPATINAFFSDENLAVQGSAGKGGWAESPWIAVINKKMTDAPQEGVYVVYLFSSDLTRVYLTLAQGITRPVALYGRKDAFKRLHANAENIRVNFKLEGFEDFDTVELGEGNRASAYEESIIYAKKYSTKDLPIEEQLETDIKTIVNFYTDYLNQRDVLTADTDFSSTIGAVEEGKRLLRQHYVRERNPKIIKEAKKLALQKKGELRCEVCSFSFEEIYDGRCKNYIEGHHRKSVSEMREGDKTAVVDIAMLCSNCHRAIHAKWPYISVEELKTLMVEAASSSNIFGS